MNRTPQAALLVRTGLRFAVFLGLILLPAADASAQDLEKLGEQIRSEKSEVQRDALHQIRNLRTEEASRLAVPALRDTDEIVRATAASAVVFLPQDEAYAVLSPLLSDRSEFVRREAAYALGRVRHAAAVKPLLEILQRDRVMEVRTAAVVALGQIGDRAAVDPLVRILRRRPVEEEEFLRRSAARSIGQIAQVIQTGEVRVLTPENFLPESYKQPEKPQYSKLAEQFPVFRAALPVLIAVLRNRAETDDTRREAAFALGAIGDVQAVPALEANLDSPDYYLAEICREALRKIAAAASTVVTE